MADTLSMVILLLIAFAAWSQGITWLFFGSLVLLVVVARSVSIFIVVALGLGAVYFLKLQQYLFLIMVVIAAAIILVKGRHETSSGGGGEMYSPELMKLLGGGA
ncbi:hypothetical protein HYS54_03560 [Candidatus Micrarchaeota archaeon]|nr:hypothetical protein [Candidatus Micrarchaeota archaeon]